MKKILLSKNYFFLGLVGFPLLLVEGIYGFTNFNLNAVIVSALILVLLMAIVCLYLINVGGTTITYDKEKQLLKRKGFFCGYKYSLKVSEIKNVVFAYIPFFGKLIIFIDDKFPEIELKYRFDFVSKRGFVSIPNNEKNMELVRTFWDKPIEDIGDLREILLKNKKIDL